jgi:hypothetical protein
LKLLIKNKIGLIWLLILPLAVYFFSYIYLAVYHKKLFLFNTIVHESGKYTLLEDIFYASHFLGHVPVLTFLAFYFVGVFAVFNVPVPKKNTAKFVIILISSIIFLLGVSYLLSVKFFGIKDTLDFIMQLKQSESISQKGGSWLLHLPSSIMLFLLIPPYIFYVMRLTAVPAAANKKFNWYIIFGIILFFAFTAFFTADFFGSLKLVWTDPRYLAHSVRELATFPVTYFPIALFFLFGKSHLNSLPSQNCSNNSKYMILFTLTFIGLLIYQMYVSLTAGIGQIAQKPAFAESGSLSICYLLASHYFEHFLDTIYFTLLCLLLYNIAFIRLFKHEVKND